MNILKYIRLFAAPLKNLPSSQRSSGGIIGAITMIFVTLLFGREGSTIAIIPTMGGILWTVARLIFVTAGSTALLAAPLFLWQHGIKAGVRALFSFFVAALVGAAVVPLMVSGLISQQFTTTYAPEYSAVGFWSITKGMTEAEVIGILGEPLQIDESRPFTAWLYTDQSQNQFAKYGQAGGNYTLFQFDEAGQLIQIYGQLEAEGRIYFGEGANYLQISTQSAKQLYGSTAVAIKSQYGTPQESFVSTAVSVYRYSRAGGDGHYLIREIGFDADGLVVYIDKQIYWD